jgi:alkanesulfonate monooxygenase SsuD/methylene tetrahydromethanopterin reductase-like flavin-dependent oxidoreductase (luciferase family)
VRFGLFYEHQNPRPWEDERTEHRLLKDALDQIELADRLGFDRVWEVEHHFLEEYSHSSAPEVFLAAASQRTERIRLGHGIVQIPPAVNHPARVAERIATLDLICDGRLDFGTGESSSAAELGGFLVDRNSKRAMWEDAIDAIARMFVEEPFCGWDSEYIQMPPRNVVPKPLQKPHPPMWVACSRRETIHFAARNGIGALTFSFVEPEDAGKWVDEYYELIASEECVPAGFAVEPQFAVVLPMMCHADEQEAIERGIDGAHFFGYSLAHFYGMGRHRPGRTNVWEEFQANRGEKGFAREIITADDASLGVRLMQQGVGSLRGAIGTPDQIRDMARRYEAVGVDEMIFVLQAGRNRHEHICESLELFAAEVLPEFADRVGRREAEKAERLAPAIAAALARREPPRKLPEGYEIDEAADLERARRSRSQRTGLRERAAAAADELRQRARRQGREGLARFVRGATPEQLERRFGNRLAQRILFNGMTRQFDPKFAQGFEGDIVYELEHHSDGGPSRSPDVWTIRISGERATAIPEASTDPAVRFRFAVPDFARLIAGEVRVPELIFDGRFDFEGDIQVAQRLPVMFGELGGY